MDVDMYQSPFKSDMYAAESMAADMDQWITFDARKDQSEGPVEVWVEKYSPAQISREDGVGWIAVHAPEDSTCPESDVFGLQNAWEQMQESGRPINLRTITELAKTYGVTTGKWLFHSGTGLKVHHMWSLVAKATANGTLGKSAKVSPFNTDEDRHVICIYNDDFTDKDAVYTLENRIRSIGIKCPLSYKPDVYTYLGIYRNNKWGLRPTICHSVFDLMKGTSFIEDN